MKTVFFLAFALITVPCFAAVNTVKSCAAKDGVRVELVNQDERLWAMVYGLDRDNETQILGAYADVEFKALQNGSIYSAPGFALVTLNAKAPGNPGKREKINLQAQVGDQVLRKWVSCN